MGTSNGLDALAVKLAAVTTALDGAAFLRRAHEAIGKEGKQDAARIGGAMSVWSKGRASHRSVKLTARYDVDERSVRIRPRQGGLWAIREDGAKGHAEPKARKRPSKKRGKVLAFSGGGRKGDGFAASADHPGLAGEERWTHVRVEVEREAPRIVDGEVRRTLAKTFGSGS